MLKLDRNNIGIIPLMLGTFTSYFIDRQVIKLIPNTLLCLNTPFIKVLKERNGLLLIQDIESKCVEDFVSICALSSSKNYASLRNYMDITRNTFIEK